MKSEGGVASVALPAVPLPESIARSLKVPSTGVPFGSQAQSSSGALPPPPAAQAAPPPKPFYRPFAISPPPSTAPPPIPSSAPPPVPHPAYRHFGLNPYYHPGSLAPPPVSTYGDFAHYPYSYGANGLIPPAKTTTPSITGTNTVASSHYDLTCRSHLPKLAHALTTTAPRATPPAPPPKPYHHHLPPNDPANLRRELDSRYFNRNLALGPHPFMRSDLASSPLAPPLSIPPSSQSPSFLASSLVIVNCSYHSCKYFISTYPTRRNRCQKWADPIPCLPDWVIRQASTGFRHWDPWIP